MGRKRERERTRCRSRGLREHESVEGANSSITCIIRFTQVYGGSAACESGVAEEGPGCILPLSYKAYGRCAKLQIRRI